MPALPAFGRGTLTVKIGEEEISGNVTAFSIDQFVDDPIKHQDFGSAAAINFFDKEYAQDDGYQGSFTVDTDLKNAMQALTNKKAFVDPIVEISFKQVDPTGDLQPADLIAFKLINCKLTPGGGSNLITQQFSDVSFSWECRKSKGGDLTWLP